MAFNIHKPGQGYWVRALTAAMAGVLVLATCAWLWAQVGLVKLPTTEWLVRATAVQGAPPAADASVSLMMPKEGAAGEFVEVGTGRVKGAEAQGQGVAEVRVGALRLEKGRVSDNVKRLQAGTGEGAFVADTAGITAVRLFETLYLQAGVVLVVLLAGVGLVYWIVGVKPAAADFLIATDGEMRKVNWSTRRDIIASTWVVIGASVLIAAGLFMVDNVFATFFRLIGVLEQ